MDISKLRRELDLLDKLDWDSTEYRGRSYDPNRKVPDEDLYETIKNSFGDVQTPSQLPEKSNRTTYRREFLQGIEGNIIHKLSNFYKSSHIEVRGIYYYPPGAVCGWHTNSDFPGKRVYITWAEEDNKSFFRYFDKETKQIITKYDKKGWHINEFTIPRNGQLWHYIGSPESRRKSVGFLIS